MYLELLYLLAVAVVAGIVLTLVCEWVRGWITFIRWTKDNGSLDWEPPDNEPWRKP